MANKWAVNRQKCLSEPNRIYACLFTWNFDWAYREIREILAPIFSRKNSIYRPIGRIERFMKSRSTILAVNNGSEKHESRYTPKQAKRASIKALLMGPENHESCYTPNERQREYVQRPNESKSVYMKLNELKRNK